MVYLKLWQPVLMPKIAKYYQINVNQIKYSSCSNILAAIMYKSNH